MKYARVQINFYSENNQGWSAHTSTDETIDMDIPIRPQAKQAVDAWIERQNRIFGSTLRGGVVTSIFYRGDNGAQYVIDARTNWEI
jgi:hypothetical protein